MFPVNSSLLGGSVSWDTNYARVFLKIPEDQLEKINNIPGWSKTENFEKTVPENEKIVENTDKQLTPQALTSTENFQTNNTHNSVKEINNLNPQNHSSVLQSQQNFVASLSKKEAFLKNLDLSPLRKNYTAVYPLKRSSSLPHLPKELLSAELFDSESEDVCRKRVHSIEKDISNLKLAPQVKILLNEILTVPLTSDLCINPKLVEINSHKSCPLEYPNQLLKEKRLLSLDDSILNSKSLKGIGTPVTKSIVSLSSYGADQTVLKQGMSVLEKKLLLLEKRLCVPKEMTPPPFNAKLINIENLNPENNLKPSQDQVSSDVIATATASSDSVEDLLNEIQNSPSSKSHKSLQSQASNEKKDFSKNGLNTGEVVKSPVCNFSFISPPVPCGQPLPTENSGLAEPTQEMASKKQKQETLSKTPSVSQSTAPPVHHWKPIIKDVPSLSEPIPSQESAKLNLPGKSQKGSHPILSGQPLPTEVPSPSQPLLSQKPAEQDTCIKLQNAALSGKNMAPEKPSDALSVFSGNSNEKVSDLAPTKESGTKRKRRNKIEKLSKKSDVKKLKRIDIQFSSAQIKRMIDIMKIFHTEF